MAADLNSDRDRSNKGITEIPQLIMEITSANEYSLTRAKRWLRQCRRPKSAKHAAHQGNVRRTALYMSFKANVDFCQAWPGFFESGYAPKGT